MTPSSSAPGLEPSSARSVPALQSSLRWMTAVRSTTPDGVWLSKELRTRSPTKASWMPSVADRCTPGQRAPASIGCESPLRRSPVAGFTAPEERPEARSVIVRAEPAQHVTTELAHLFDGVACVCPEPQLTGVSAHRSAPVGDSDRREHAAVQHAQIPGQAIDSLQPEGRVALGHRSAHEAERSAIVA